MAWDPMNFFFLMSSGAQPVLTQTASMDKSLGATVKLTCTLSSSYSNYYVIWYQQLPGKSPRYVMKVNSDGSYTKGDGIPNRFSGSSSGDNRYLTISGVQSEDEADYYCGESHTIDGQKGSHRDTGHWGSETKTFLAQQLARPWLPPLLLIPPDQSLLSLGLSLSCSCRPCSESSS
uniref:Ig-like domain-containing protein n=1 Tax=Ornithorhynchus anatinus TaxID=9258 RepID=F6UJN8_ORNAN